MRKMANKRPTLGVLAGIQVYYGTILGNFIGPLLHGVSSAAEHRGCNLLMACGMDSSSYSVAHPAWPIPSTEADYVPVGPWNTDGLIVVTPLFSESRSKYIQDLIAAGHPVVFAASGEEGPTVSIDNEGAIRQALVHLMGHGHRQIAFIAGYPNDSTGDSGIRLRAFQQIAQECGLSSNQNLIAYGNHGINGGQQAMRQILDSHIPFTAVLASNDESAIGAMTVLKTAGLRIPQDVAIIGIDDTIEAMTQVPPLTTFHSSPFRMGYQALELLLDYIEGRSNQLDSLTMPMQFVIRESCGCQPKAFPYLISHNFEKPILPQDTSVLRSQLTQTITEVVLAGTQRLSPEEVNIRCQHLAETFLASVQLKNTIPFHHAVEETLTRVEALEDDIYVWDAVLSMLENSADLIPAIIAGPPDERPFPILAAGARAMITQYMQRQHRHLIIHQIWIADQIGQLNARLLTALDEAQVYRILMDFLPQVGIQHMDVAFFEEREEDPYAHYRLRKVSEQRSELHAPGDQFPPKDTYREPYHLVLLPMTGHEERHGFVVFEAANLEVCAHIVWQLITFLKVVRLYRDATQGRQLAEEANHLKSRFLSTVSHELRTPLHLIVGLSEILFLNREKADPQIQRDLKRIYASAQHLDGLIRDVLDLAQNEMGELKLACAPLDLAEALALVAEVGGQLAQDKGLKWQADLPDYLPQIWGDRTRLRQVTLNLINNAVKFTESGQVTLRISATDELVTVEVSDSGLGIRPEEQEVIFDEFRQSERTTERGYGGLGLGLAICKRLIEMHGGMIGVQSAGQEGSGSRFYYTLPILKSEEPRRAPETNFPQNILLFAERYGDGQQLRDFLVRHGFEVELVWSDASNERSSWLKSQPGALVLEQSTMTEQGWEIIKTLREDPHLQSIPFLVYSLNGKQDVGSVLELNALTKPIHRTELIRALENRRSDRASAGRVETILIVDDEPGTLELHTRLIRSWSQTCKVLTARNGREALEILKQAHPDLVLLDLIMPEVDGFGVLEAMRNDPHSRDIPVIVLTGQTLTLEDMETLGKGVNRVLKKGLFSAEETLSHIEEALARHTALGNEAQRAVRRATIYLHERYMEPISLDDTARYVNVSKEYLARCFRQEMGITLVTYLNRYRVDEAKILLEKGERNLTEVALATGFASSSYFSRVFRQEVGMSPTDYVKYLSQSNQ